MKPGNPQRNPLLRIKANACMLVLYIAAGLLWVSSSATGQPHLEVRGGTQIVLDPLFEGTTTVKSILLMNTGRDSLLIDNVTTSCGCTTARLSNKWIAPHDTIQLSVSFESKDISGDIVRHVYLASNDSDQEKLDITFTGTIVTIIVAKPRYKSFGAIPLGGVERRGVELLNTTNRVIHIISDSVPDPRLSIVLKGMEIPPHGSRSLEVIARGRKKGKLWDQIVLRTDDPVKPIVKLSYTGQVGGH